MTVVGALLLGAVGALGRAEVTARLGVRRGTAVVNLLGAWLLGLLVGLAGGADADSGTLLVLGVGFCGALTTFSTWMLDVTDRDEGAQVPAVVVTGLVGLGVAGVGWLLGALVG